MSTQTATKANVRPGAKIIVRYGNRKLYDASSACYVSTHHLLDLVHEGTPFEVVQSPSKEIYTAQVLCQMLCALSRRKVPLDTDKLIEVLRDCPSMDHNVKETV